MKGKSKEQVNKEIEKIIAKLQDLNEGYLSQFEDEDPEASVKSEIDGLIDYTKSTLREINNLY